MIVFLKQIRHTKCATECAHNYVELELICYVREQVMNETIKSAQFDVFKL